MALDAEKNQDILVRAEDEDMNVKEMLAYLGLYRNSNEYRSDDEVALAAAVEQLEEILVDEDVDVEVDDDDKLVSVRAAKMRDVLFNKHERDVGHRPDNPQKVREAKAHEQQKREERRAARVKGKDRLKKRVMKRRAARGSG